MMRCSAPANCASAPGNLYSAQSGILIGMSRTRTAPGVAKTATSAALSVPSETGRRATSNSARLHTEWRQRTTGDSAGEGSAMSLGRASSTTGATVSKIGTS